MKVGWILSGNEVVAGARIQGLNIHRQLDARGIESRILHAPDAYSLAVSKEKIDAARVKEGGFDVVVFQKVCEGDAESIARELNQLGVRTIYLACELCGHNMVAACDTSIAVSEFLKAAYGRRYAGKISVIPDALEVPEYTQKQAYGPIGSSLKAIYLGSAVPDRRVLAWLSVIADRIELTVICGGYVPESDKEDQEKYQRTVLQKLAGGIRMGPADMIQKILRKRQYRRTEKEISKLLAAPDIPFQRVAWHADTVCDEIIKHDVAVIPCDLTSDHNMSKSSNRLTMMMALGMPTVVSPLPAYVDVIKQGENGFVAASAEEWRNAVEALQDEVARERIGRKAREDVIEHFSVERIARRYLEVFRNRDEG